ncbi:MAG: T9SS type A sorting domain-containing protein [Bacteroidota bacterium]|nr:T9SS type A sorting domain-containing protein [Bacteroidota bacterium]
MNHRLLKLIGVTLLFAGLITSSYAEGVKGGKKNILGKTAGNPSRTLFNINNISTWFSSDGQSDLNPQGNSGFVFPKGSGKAAVFQSGFVWGGKVDGNIRVGGVTYQSGLKSGRIISQGVAQNPDDADARIFRVRPDWRTGSMNAEIRDGEGTEAEIRAQYEKDWNEWPAQYGAPYKDVDGNGSYDPNIDIPGVPGASQTIWYVANDLDATTCSSLYGSNPIGIELQTTIWGYSSAGALGNMLFRKYKIINKSGKDITDMYVSNWSDIDDGDATDDYAACDTTLSLAYCYNASVPDGVYGANPPAVGFDFFQGPIVSGAANDSAIFNGKRLYGKKNLPMTAFYYFINSDAIMADPTLGTNYQAGTLRFWNLFQGKISTTGEYFPIPASLGGGITKFPLSGDPVKGTGYLDGILFPKQDRRIGSASGPFVMANQDTQEIVVAEIAAGGPGSGLNNIKAVELLKNYDNIAQKAYDEFFVLPSSPEPPKVNVAELDREIVLNWGSDTANVRKTESHDAQGFKFEGYNVYQLPSASATMKEATRIATFDVVDDIKYILGDVVDPATGVTLKAVQQFGSDNGIQRYLNIDKDYLTNMPLINGKKYYYAVTSYAYTADPLAVPNNLENPLNIITVVPHTPNPGVKYSSTYSDTIAVTRLSGGSDGKIVAYVVDPKAVTGHDYKIEFEQGQLSDGTDGYLWKVTDVTTNTVKLSKMEHQAKISEPNDGNFMIVDGVMIKVFGPPNGLKADDVNSTDDQSKWGWSVPAGTRRWTWANANTNLAGMETFGANAGYQNCIASGQWWGSTVGYDKLKNVLFKFAATDTAGTVLDVNGENVSYAYRYVRGAQSAPAKPEFANFLKNKESYGFQDFVKNFPFAAYDMEANPPRRLAVGFLENNVANGSVDGKYWPPLSSAGISNSASATGAREWFIIFDANYKETVDTTLNINLAGEQLLPIMYVGMPTRRSNTGYVVGDQFALWPNHINTAKDAWQFKSATVTVSDDAAKADVEKINVFPNPYYAVNSQELNKYQKFVTFSHLPQDATLRIFNLAGQLVRTIQKNTTDQFQRWDLNNDSGLPVASGLYIVHVDMPKLGKTKILKVAVIQEQQILDRF